MDSFSCPPAPNLRLRRLQSPGQSEILQLSLLLAPIIAGLTINVRSEDLIFSASQSLPVNPKVDTDVLSELIDLLAWLQLGAEIVFLAGIFLTRFNALPTFDRSYSIWAQLIVSLKFAQTLLHDEPFAHQVWKDALDRFGYSADRMVDLEFHLLSNDRLSLFVTANDWPVMVTRMKSMSMSLFQRMGEFWLNSPTGSSSRWIIHKQEICELYQWHTLEDVARLMKDRHDFSAR